jgi:hypothetical protein
MTRACVRAYAGVYECNAGVYECNAGVYECNAGVYECIHACVCELSQRLQQKGAKMLLRYPCLVFTGMTGKEHHTCSNGDKNAFAVESVSVTS